MGGGGLDEKCRLKGKIEKGERKNGGKLHKILGKRLKKCIFLGYKLHKLSTRPLNFILRGKINLKGIKNDQNAQYIPLFSLLFIFTIRHPPS